MKNIELNTQFKKALELIDKGKNARLAFGDIQMIFIGDLYQLPPVVVGKEREMFLKRVIQPQEIDTMKYLDKQFLGVAGYDYLRDEDRVFRVDRILEMR